MNTVFLAVPVRSGITEATRALVRAGYEAEQAGNGRWRIGTPTEHAWLFEEEQPSELPESLRHNLALAAQHRDRSVLVLEYYSLRW